MTITKPNATSINAGASQAMDNVSNALAALVNKLVGEAVSEMIGEAVDSVATAVAERASEYIDVSDLVASAVADAIEDVDYEDYVHSYIDAHVSWSEYVDGAIEDYDMSSAVDSAMYDYDFSDHINDAVADHDFSDAMSEAVADYMQQMQRDVTAISNRCYMVNDEVNEIRTKMVDDMASLCRLRHDVQATQGNFTRQTRETNERLDWMAARIDALTSQVEALSTPFWRRWMEAAKRWLAR